MWLSHDTALYFGDSMKKIFSYIYIIMVCLCACGCSQKEHYYEGKELIDRAAEIHTSFGSATVSVSEGAETVQYIEYRFEGEVMQYMYSAHVDGKHYYEYNNGTELNYITLPDETEWSFAAKGSEGYYTYSKASRHYFADGAQLFNDFEAAVSSSEIHDTGEQMIVKLDYDTKKLSEYTAFREYGDFKEFTMVFYIDKDGGNCIQFRNDYTSADGTNYSYWVRMFERDANEPVKRIEIE